MDTLDELTTFDYTDMLHETDKAILFETGMGEVWIPKDEIVEHDEDAMTVTIPTWLAEEKDLV